MYFTYSWYFLLLNDPLLISRNSKQIWRSKMPLSITMTQGFVVFLAFCYFACLFLAFFILYLIFESWQSEGPDDEGQIEDAIRAGPFAQSNWLPKSMAYVSYYSAQWVIWHWKKCIIEFDIFLRPVIQLCWVMLSNAK